MTVYQNIRRYIAWWTVGITLIYMITAYVINNLELLIFLRSMRVAFAGAIIWRYRYALKAVWKDEEDLSEEHIGTFGLVMFVTGFLFGDIWLLVWRAGDEPVSMINSAWQGYWLLITIIGALIFISAPGARHGEMTRSALRTISVSMVIAMSMATCSYVFRAETRHMLLKLRPYFAEYPEEPEYFIRDLAPEKRDTAIIKWPKPLNK